MFSQAGTQNAGLAIGGKSPSYETDTEEYDGTSYAAGGNLPAGTACLAAAGTQNYSIAFWWKSKSNNSSYNS